METEQRMRKIMLSRSDWEKLINVLTCPKPPNKRLKSAIKKHLEKR